MSAPPGLVPQVAAPSLLLKELRAATAELRSDLALLATSQGRRALFDQLPDPDDNDDDRFWHLLSS